MDLNDLDDAEKFARHFVQPVVDQLAAKLEPVIAKVNTIEQRIIGTEDRLARAELKLGSVMRVYTAALAGLTWLGHWAWAKFQRKI